MELSKDESVRLEILNRAQKLFQQYGLKKTTMDEIAVACGKAKSTLYHYFKSKEEVFDAVINMELIHLRKIVKDAVDEKRSAKDKMVAYFIRFHEEAMNKMNLYRIIKYELHNEYLGQHFFKRLMDFEISYVTRILEDGYDIGELPSFAKREIPLLSELLLAAFFGIVRHSIETEEGIDQEKLELASRTLIPRIFS